MDKLNQTDTTSNKPSFGCNSIVFGTDLSTLLHNAKTKMPNAKKNGTNGYA